MESLRRITLSRLSGVTGESKSRGLCSPAFGRGTNTLGLAGGNLKWRQDGVTVVFVNVNNVFVITLGVTVFVDVTIARFNLLLVKFK